MSLTFFNLINLYSVLLVIGVQLTRMIESNTLTKEADGDALAFFESYAATIKSHNHCAAAIVYLRVLFLYSLIATSSRCLHARRRHPSRGGAYSTRRRFELASIIGTTC